MAPSSFTMKISALQWGRGNQHSFISNSPNVKLGIITQAEDNYATTTAIHFHDIFEPSLFFR